MASPAMATTFLGVTICPAGRTAEQGYEGCSLASLNSRLRRIKSGTKFPKLSTAEGGAFLVIFLTKDFPFPQSTRGLAKNHLPASHLGDAVHGRFGDGTQVYLDGSPPIVE